MFPDRNQGFEQSSLLQEHHTNPWFQSDIALDHQFQIDLMSRRQQNLAVNAMIELYSNQAVYMVDPERDRIGAGMMAHVYRVTWQDQPCALKLLADPAYAERFFDEADLLVEFAAAPPAYGLEIDSRWLVPRVVDQQRTGDRRFLVMDLAPGRPLDDLLRGEPGYLPELDALTIGEQLCRVFRCLHDELQRTYLDFRPENVFWDGDARQIMVIDWNVLSQRGQVDVATDLDALGRLLCWMLTGMVPPQSGLHEAVRWNELSLGTRLILQQALHHQADRRFASAAELHQALADQVAAWNQPANQLIQDAVRLHRAAALADEEEHERLQQQSLSLLDLASRVQPGPSPAFVAIRDNLDAALQAALDRSVAERHLAGIQKEIIQQQKHLEGMAAAVADERQALMEARQELEAVENVIDIADARLLSLHGEIALAEQRVQENEDELHARVQEMEGKLNQALEKKKEQIAQQQNLLEELFRQKESTLADLQSWRAALEQEISDLRQDTAELVSVTAVTSFQQSEMDKLQSTIKDILSQKMALEQEVANLRFRVNRLHPAAGTPSPGPSTIGWQRLVEALKLTQTGVLSEVKYAIAEAEAIATEAAKTGDRKLESEARTFVQAWQPWYRRNLEGWDAAQSHHVHGDSDQSLRTYQDLYRNGVRGATKSGEIEEEMVYMLSAAASAIVERNRQSQGDRHAYFRDFEQMRSYAEQADELMRLSTDQKLSASVEWIGRYYKSWVEAAETLPAKDKNKETTLD